MTRRLHPKATGTPRRPLRSLLHGGAIAALSIVLAGTASGVTFALWHANATVSSTASSADLELTTSGFDSLDKTFANHTLTTTGSFTVTNATVTNSTQLADYGVALSYSGDAALAGKLSVATWPTTDPSGCATSGATPGTAATGTWAAFPSDPARAIAGKLAEQKSASYCVRVTTTERGLIAAGDGAMAIQPTISATLKLGGWSDSESESTVQETAWIYPAFGPTANTWYQLKNQGSGKCVDVNGASTASGTAIIDYPCKAEGSNGDDNQHWKFTRSSGDYYDITPRNSQSLRLDVVAGSALGAINVATDAAGQVTQEWQVQAQPGGVYQIVNRLSGLCLQPSNTLKAGGNPQYVSVVCNGSPAQRYTFSERGVDVPAVALVCATGTNGVTYSWTGGAIGNYVFTAQPVGGGPELALGSAAENETAFPVLPGAIGEPDGEYTITATWNGNTLDVDSLWKTTTGETSALSCAPPPPPLNALTCAPNPPRSVEIGWGHAALEPYTIQLLSYGEWIWVGTAPSGASSFVLSADYWSDGVRDIRVVSGATSAQITVYNSGGNGNEYLFCEPPNPVQAACSNGGNGNDVRLFWPTVPGTDRDSEVQGSFVIYGQPVTASWDVDRYDDNSMSRISIADDDVDGIPNGTYSLTLSMLGTSLGMVDLRVAGNNIYCD